MSLNLYFCSSHYMRTDSYFHSIFSYGRLLAKVNRLTLCLFFSLLILYSCRYNPSKFQEKHLVVTTTGMIGDALKAILPADFEIVVLMGAGVDPHLYEAKPRDIQRMAAAETIVYNGLHLEGKLSRLFEKLKREKSIYAISDSLPESRLIRANAYTHDPHIWLDPFLWADGLEGLTKSLMIRYPEFAEEIERNSEIYLASMRQMGNEIKVILSNIPKDKRVLITSHDAFSYFGRVFNVEVRALQGISTISEPGIQTVTILTDFIVERKIAALFVESSVSGKSMRALREACARKGHTIIEGGTLYSDAMGDKASGADTYLKMIRTNAQTLVKGLKK